MEVVIERPTTTTKKPGATGSSKASTETLQPAGLCAVLGKDPGQCMPGRPTLRPLKTLKHSQKIVLKGTQPHTCHKAGTMLAPESEKDITRNGSQSGEDCSVDKRLAGQAPGPEVNLQNTCKLPHQMVRTCNLSAKLIPGAS